MTVDMRLTSFNSDNADVVAGELHVKVDLGTGGVREGVPGFVVDFSF